MKTLVKLLAAGVAAQNVVGQQNNTVNPDGKSLVSSNGADLAPKNMIPNIPAMTDMEFKELNLTGTAIPTLPGFENSSDYTQLKDGEKIPGFDYVDFSQLNTTSYKAAEKQPESGYESNDDYLSFRDLTDADVLEHAKQFGYEVSTEVSKEDIIDYARRGLIGLPPASKPTFKPSVKPTTFSPSAGPSVQPTISPSAGPSLQPTISPSAGPSVQPTVSPSAGPSVQPTVSPSAGPSVQPTVSPSAAPSVEPTTFQPSASPSVEPTYAPTAEVVTDDGAVVNNPTAGPTAGPTAVPVTSGPTRVPTRLPTTARKPTLKPVTSSPTSTGRRLDADGNEIEEKVEEKGRENVGQSNYLRTGIMPPPPFSRFTSAKSLKEKDKEKEPVK